MSNTIPAPAMKDAAYRKACVKKWKKVLFAEHAAPIQDAHTRGVVAVLLENQMNAIKNGMVTESLDSGSIWGGGGFGGGAVTATDSYAKGDNRLPKTILPMIRRTFPELIANEVVGVQPMSSPISLAFAFRYHYEKGPLHERRSAGSLTEPTPAGPHYGVGTDYVHDVAGHVDMTQMNATVDPAGNGRGAEMGYNYLDSGYSGRRNELFNRTINPATGAPWTDGDITTTWNTSTVGQADPVTTIDELKELAATNEAAAKLLQVTSIAGGAIQFSDQDLGVAALTGDYEATGRVPRATFSFEKKGVEAGTRRIATSWTLELEQDIRNMQGINIEDEVTSLMSYELQAEIDREIVVRMLWSALGANEYSYWDGSKADARWMAERDRAFYQFLVQMSNRMAMRNRRGPANFIVATPDVCTLLETLPQFKLMEVTASINTNNVGIAKVGTVGNRFTLYRDSRTPVQNNSWMNNAWDNQGQYTVGGVRRQNGIPDFALLGYKGSEYWDAGIIFCPYIPIMLQRVVDPVSWQPNVGLITRYGVVDNLFGAHLYYHMVIISTLSNTLPPKSSPANTFPANYPGTVVDAETLAPNSVIVGPTGAALKDTAQPGGYSIVDNTPVEDADDTEGDDEP